MAERVAVRLDSRHVKLDDKGRKLRAKMGDGYVESLKVAIETLGAIEERDWNAETILEKLKARAEAAG